MRKIVIALAAVFTISLTLADATMVPTQTPAIAASDFSISANMAIVSNYVWRGMTQTGNLATVQGGIDLGYKGFYLGTWGSFVKVEMLANPALETNFYLGYASEFSSIAYDISFIQYAYTHDPDILNFKEASLGLSKDFDGFGLNAKYSFGLGDAPDYSKTGTSVYLPNSKHSFGPDDASDYWEAGTSVNLPMDVGLSISYGDYADIGSNYIVSLSKEIAQFEVSLAYTSFQAATLSELKDENHILATIGTNF